MDDPLWRCKTGATEASARVGSFLCVLVDLPVPPGTEVEVWRAGDRADLDAVKAGVRRLVSIRLTNPGSDYEQRAWDDLMALVGDGDD